MVTGKQLTIIAIMFSVIALAANAHYDWKLFQFTPMSVVCNGFSDLSLGQVNFVSFDPQINGQSWVLTVVQNCQGQYAVGIIDSSQIKDENTEAKYDLKITTNVDNQKCNYPISYQNTQIKHMNYQTKICYLGLVCDGTLGYNALDWKNECKAKSGYYAWIEHLLGTSDPYSYTCFWTTDSAGYGIVGTSSLSFQSTISAEVQGETKTATISSLGAGSAWLGDKVYATWQGNLVSGDSCPNSGDYHISAAYVNGQWRTINNDNYNTWKTYNDAGMINCLDRYNGRTETPTSCMNNYNTLESNALSGKTLISPGGSQAYATGSQNNGQVIIDLNKMIQFPVLTMHVKADWLGIFVPVGKPQIVSLSMPDFQTGTVSNIKVDVKNIGDGDGSFGVYATCTGGFSQQGGEQYINLGSGSSGTVYISVTATCNQETTGSCTVNAYDRNQPNNKDSGSVSGKCKPIILCTANEWRCNGQWREQCNQAGTSWNGVQKCDKTCEMKGFEAVCSDSNQTCKREGEACGIGNICCQDLKCTSGLLNLGLIGGKCTSGGGGETLDLSVIFGLIAGAFAFFSSGGIKNYKDEEYDSLAISAIYAIIAGIATWWFISNIYMILAGSIILTMLGVALLWFFGPALIVLFGTIGAVIKSIKGD